MIAVFLLILSVLARDDSEGSYSSGKLVFPSCTSLHRSEGQLVLEELRKRKDLATLNQLEAATILIVRFGSAKVLEGLGVKADGRTDQIIPDAKLIIGPVGTSQGTQDDYAFSAIRFLGTCGDVDRLLQHGEASLPLQ